MASDERAKLEAQCRKCQQDKQRRDPYASHMARMQGCNTCPTGLKLQQLDNPAHRGKVSGYGGKRPW